MSILRRKPTTTQPIEKCTGTIHHCEWQAIHLDPGTSVILGCQCGLNVYRIERIA